MGHFYELPKEFHPDFAFPRKKPNRYNGVDRTDKYGKHLVAGYLMGGEVGVLRDVTGRYDATYNGGANEPVTKASTPGQYLDFSAASTNTSRFNIDSAALRSLFDGTKPFTLVFHARTDDVAINTAAFSIDGTDDFIVYLSDGTDRRFRVFWRDVTPGVTFNQTGTKYQGTWNIYQYSFDGDSGHAIAINGDIVSTGSASASGAGPYSSGPAIAGWAGGSTQYYRDDLASVFIFGKDFSNQAQDLANKLYRSLNPTIPLTYFIPSAGGGGPTPIPPRLQRLDNQHATIMAHRLNGMLQ